MFLIVTGVGAWSRPGAEDARGPAAYEVEVTIGSVRRAELPQRHAARSFVAYGACCWSSPRPAVGLAQAGVRVGGVIVFLSG